MQPLKGVRVLDFSTLLPGPMASLILAEAGAEVIKVERPGSGEEMRSYEPKIGADSVNFVMLNRGKRSMTLDLKSPDALKQLEPLIAESDVLLEQFRPGVMHRLGLDYERLRSLNHRLIYCSITGWGQNGPKSAIAAHDLNYMAETGVLGICTGTDGTPGLPQVLVADIAGGAYPAVINILLALKQRESTGMGMFIDVSMGENLFPFMYWGLGSGFAGQGWPGVGSDMVSGGSPRYQIYRTADARFVAAAPLEEKFWDAFCAVIDLPVAYRRADVAAAAVISAVRQRIASRTAGEWQRLFAGKDLCCSIVLTLQEAVDDPHFQARNTFSLRVGAHGQDLPALPVPVAAEFRASEHLVQAPALGEGGLKWADR